MSNRTVHGIGSPTTPQAKPDSAPPSSAASSPRRGGRKRSGQLILRATGWYARVQSRIDGEDVRVTRALGTQNKIVARRLLKKLLAAEDVTTVDVMRPETFTEAAERFYNARIEERPEARGPKQDLRSLHRHALPAIGHMSVVAVEAKDINTVLDQVKAAGLGQQTLVHVKQQLSNVFIQLRREGVRRDNPAADASLPAPIDCTTKERAVLTDAELALYLAWEHARPRAQSFVRERQTMACVARMFGGLRTGDLHALRWEALDTDAFEWGYAPRQKTRRPQLLGIPIMLRPMLRDWWERQGSPREGVVFPARRVGKRGDRVGLQRIGVSHAGAFRRDLQQAFAAARELRVEGAPDPMSRRWRELFTETEYMLPVDFHSWRRAFAQALADADVNAQQASALAGHASLDAHARYLRNAGKLREVPELALPDMRAMELSLATAKEKALAKGSPPDTTPETPEPPRPPAQKVQSFPPTLLPSVASHAAGREFESHRPLNKSGDFGVAGGTEKALALPNAPAGVTVTALPAQPRIGLLDVLRAADAAVVAGELPRARSLIAAAVIAIEAGELSGSACAPSRHVK